MELTFPEGFVIIALEMEPFSLNAFQIGGAEVCSFPGRSGCRGGPLWEVVCRGSPELSVWTQGHWLTLMPIAVISVSSQPSREVGIRTLSLELSNGGDGTCWGLSHRQSGGKFGLLTLLQAPSSLPQNICLL